jgi:hypothetical protein
MALIESLNKTQETILWTIPPPEKKNSNCPKQIFFFRGGGGMKKKKRGENVKENVRRRDIKKCSFKEKFILRASESQILAYCRTGGGGEKLWPSK